MANKTQAPGQLHGYTLQVRHMLFELISLEDIEVSVEEIDDVAILSPDGTVVAEQVKSVTSSNNPTANRSIVFWKTLYNWFNYIKDNDIVSSESVFRMVVVSNHDITTGDLISQFNTANTKEEALASILIAKSTLWGETGELKGDIPDSYGKYLDVLFSNENSDIVVQIIEKFTLVLHENNYDEELVKKFNNQTIPTEFADKLFIYMLGWVHNKVNEYTKNGTPAIIKSKEYREALTAQIRMYNQSNAIPALSSEINTDTARTEVEKQDIYIQQLAFIEMDFDDKMEAASDYLRTKAEARIRAERGYFTEQISTEYDDQIYRTWKNEQRRSNLSSADTDMVKGQKLYTQMKSTVATLKPLGNEFPMFFGSGTLQSLANEPCEEPAIGWHPNYKKMLKGGE